MRIQGRTRTDTQDTAAAAGQFEVRAHHDGTRWHITAFDMLGQPLTTGDAAPGR